MKYYSVSFSYPRPTPIAHAPILGNDISIHFEEDEEAESSALSNAMGKVSAVLDKLNIEHKHCYCWPDGSLYQYIRTDKNENELYALINAELLQYNISVADIYPCEPTENPYKAFHKTLQSYFDGIEDQ